MRGSWGVGASPSCGAPALEEIEEIGLAAIFFFLFFFFFGNVDAVVDGSAARGGDTRSKGQPWAVLKDLPPARCGCAQKEEAVRLLREKRARLIDVRVAAARAGRWCAPVDAVPVVQLFGTTALCTWPL